MPEWSESKKPPQDLIGETWPEIFAVMTNVQKDKGTNGVLDILEPPERADFEQAVSRFVANMLTDKIMKNPEDVTKLPNPHLLVHATVVGVLAGLIYAQSAHSQEEETNEQEPKE